ncbi:MAG: dihydrolipoyl dehydrogenase [Verrucomicrobia bacterium]|nr:dihydrolipoyl dehydrogenase [Verrucomicrobiota bacterium]
MKECDVAIIGGGPGGYVAAIRAAQLGMQVICIEKSSNLGGTCLNVGCIPSKTLLYATEHLTPDFHFDQMMSRKQEVIGGLAGGISALFRKHKIEHLQGLGRLIESHLIEVNGQKVKASHIILATGSEPIALPFLPFDGKTVLSSTDALSLEAPPKKLLLVGAGVVGLELGSVYLRLGTEVRVVEFLDHICPTLDSDLSKALQKSLEKQGFVFQLSSKIIAKEGSVVKIENAQGKIEEQEAEVMLVCIGRKPYSEGLGLEAVGIQKDRRGYVQIDSNFRTAVPHIYAIGDLVDGPMLAHKASEEGVAVAELIAGKRPHINYMAIPTVIYTHPEVAGVGFTEAQAKEAGLKVKCGKFPFKANSRARCKGEEEGLVKVVTDAQTDKIVGVHIMNERAGDLIQSGVIAIEKETTARELGAMSHPHPTYAEAIKEAALAVHGEQIHF